MPSTFLGVEISKRSLLAHQRALETVGHNVANLNTEGYSRQRVTLATAQPDYPSALTNPKLAGQIGTGVVVSQIERIRDVFLDTRIQQELQGLGEYEAKYEKLHKLEIIYNEPGEENLRSLLDQFWESLEDLSVDPERLAIRAVVKERGRNLAEGIRHTYRQLSDLRLEIDQEIKDRVTQLNDFASRIAEYNLRISAAIGKGENPNDFLDKRELLIEKISKLADVRIERADPDDFKITLDEEVLVQGGFSSKIFTKPDPTNEGMVKLYSSRGEPIVVRGGELGGLLDVRDKILPYNQARLDELAITLIDRFNEVHSAGFGIDDSTGVNFFTPFAEGEEQIVYKVTGNPSGYIHDVEAPLNDPFDPININLEANTNLKNLDPIGSFEINGKVIDYDAAKDSLADLVERINRAKCGVLATISPTHRLVLTSTAEANYEISILRDDPPLAISKEEVRTGALKLDLGESFQTAGFENIPSGYVDINNVKFDLSAYSTVQDFLNDINDGGAGGPVFEDPGVVISYDKGRDRFIIIPKEPGGEILLQESPGETGVGFFTEINIPPGTYGGNLSNLRKCTRSREEVVSGTSSLSVDNPLDTAGFSHTPSGAIIINGVTFDLSPYYSTQPAPNELEALLSEVNNSDARVGISYDEKEDKFTVSSNERGDDFLLEEAQLYSSSSIGSLDTTQDFATAGFGFPIDINTTVTINDYTSSELSTYASVNDFIDEVNNSPRANVTMWYDEETQRFYIMSDTVGAPVVVRQSDTDGFLQAACFLDAGTLIEDTSPHTLYGFFTEAKIPTGSSSGNLLEVLGILKEGETYKKEEKNPIGAIAGSYIKTPKSRAAAVISISSEIEENVERIAAAKGEDTSVPLDGVADRSIGYGDNQNALDLAKLKYEKLLSEGDATFDDFLRYMVSRSAVEAATSNRETESRKLFLDHLENLRQSISGVSLDEEMVNMIKFQNAYQAAARMIGVINRAIQLVIGMGM